MKVRVKLFAVARQIAGGESIEVELPEQATVADLRRAIHEAFPELEPVLARAMMAIDTEYATNETIVPPDAEIACIPPVSGG